MDPISIALIGALASGVAKGVGEAGKSLIPDAYNALKAAIQKKLGADSETMDALERVEKKPDSKARQGVLAEEIANARLDKDPDLLKLAQTLAETLKEAGGDTFIAKTGDDSTIVQGKENMVAMGNIYLNSRKITSADFIQYFDQIDGTINSALKTKFISPTRNNELEPFSAQKLFMSLTQLGIPFTASFLILEKVQQHLINVISDITEPTTAHIREAVSMAIYNIDDPIFSTDSVQRWGDKYLRRYGNPNERIRIIERDGTESYLDYQFIKHEFFPHLFGNVFHESYESLKSNGVISSKNIQEMALRVIETINSLNLCVIRYKTLYNLILDIGSQPPHPWFVKDPFSISKTVEYDLRQASEHRMYLKKSSIDSKNRLHHHCTEIIHHSCSALLAFYGYFMGGYQLAPFQILFDLLKELSDSDGRVIYLNGVVELQMDLRNSGKSVDELLGVLKRVQREVYNVDRGDFPNLLAATMELYDIVVNLIDKKERISQLEEIFRKTDLSNISIEEIREAALYVFRRIPGWKYRDTKKLDDSMKIFRFIQRTQSEILKRLSPIVCVIVEHLSSKDIERLVNSVKKSKFFDTIFLVVSQMQANRIEDKIQFEESDINIYTIDITQLRVLHESNDKIQTLENILIEQRGDFYTV